MARVRYIELAFYSNLCTTYYKSKCNYNFDGHYNYRKVASSRPVYYSKVQGPRPKVTVHKDQISPS